MSKDIKKSLKIFACGALAGAVVLVGANNMFKKNVTNTSEDTFQEPTFSDSFKTTEEKEEYTFEYYGQDITIQGDSVKVYSWEDGKMKVEEGKKVEVPVENKYILDSYLSEKEATVYNILEQKDNIINEFAIYKTFEYMEDLYKEYLTRDNFDGLDDRKEAIYKVCYDYVISDTGYTMAGKTFKQLDKSVQNDIIGCVNDIAYMREHGVEKEESPIAEFFDTQGKVIRYELFGIGK